MRTVSASVVPLVCLVTAFALADEPTDFGPLPISLSPTPCGEGWREWQGISNIKESWAERERITSLSAGTSNEVWVGTSHGRLLSLAGDQWTLQAHLKNVQITGISPQGTDRVWLSTSDGIRRLDRENERWRLKVFRTYYEGHPSYVSGGYIPGEDAIRLWGYVDDIYIPPKKGSYAPFVISTEHGLFSWEGFHGVWHHFMPHYWGANSSWLDTRDLISHRRPTCMVEDVDANLWVGTEGEGILRLNAHGRDYCERPPGNHDRDGTEFTFFGPKDVGDDFDRVVDIAAGLERGVWAVLGLKDRRKHLARFDGTSWTGMVLPEGVRTANCVVEVKPGVILVGVNHNHGAAALVEVRWATQDVRTVSGPKYGVFEVLRTPDGRVFAASWFGLYENMLK